MRRMKRAALALLVAPLALAACNSVPPSVEETPATESALSAAGPDQLILIDGYPIDPLAPEATYQLLPAHLRTGRMVAALGGVAAPHAGLYLVQFSGPID